VTKISLEIDGRVFSMELPYNDATAEELIKGFCTLMHGQTFLICTIKDALRDAAQDYREDIEAGESFITSEPGNSMLPLYKSNEKHLVTPIKWEDCKVGDVVFCKVRGSCVTHKVYAVDNEKGCLIGNNKGHMNGWTKNVYGLAHKIDQSLKTKKV
jgi:hypothetical protein